MNKVSIIGAGAAGCFCAIEIKRRYPQADVQVYERSSRALAKVSVTGGGRCNLTNVFTDFIDTNGRYSNLQMAYPRGYKLMRKQLSKFSHRDTMEWYEREGVKLVVQEDGCVFPQSQDAMEIVNTLLSLMHKYGVKINLGASLERIEKCDEMGYNLFFRNQKTLISSHYVIVATGGCSQSFLNGLAIGIEKPLPSLFTFTLADAPCQELMGTVVEDVEVSLGGTRMKARGALLWTHWGVSGPAILKLSSYAAKLLAERNYKATLVVNWCGGRSESAVRQGLNEILERNRAKTINNVYPSFLTQKHWTEILKRCGVPLTQRCDALNPTHMNRLVSLLTAQQLNIVGRGKHKEEFVTCGGVSLTELSADTLEHKSFHGLYFAGEATDVDGITGGYNLQAAWSMGHAVAVAISEQCRQFVEVH